jgi:hypothetical protein
VAKKTRKAKKTARKTTRGVRKTSRKAARPKASAAKRGRAKAKAPAKVASKKKKPATRARKSPSKPPAKLAIVKVTRRGRRPAAAEPEASSGLTPFPPAGEVYGEQGWKEEELSAGELDTDAPELDELESDLEDAPGVGDDSDDSEEW